MFITFIGIISLLLSVIAFIKDEDKLLELAMFFSVFTAAIAIGIEVSTTPIWPFEIPVIFWIIKQIINILTGKLKIKLEKKSIERKIIFFLCLFVIIMVAGELFLYFSKISIDYYDYKFNENMHIGFSLKNITQPIRLMLFIIFTALLTIKKLDKKQIKQIINAFIYGCAFAVAFAFVQYLTQLFDLEFPTFLFNNNPYVSQGYDQQVGNLRRLTSIASEPPVLGFTLLTFLPFIVFKYEEIKNKNNKLRKKYLTFISITIVCGIMTTSTTFYFGFGIMLIYYFFKKLCNKEEKIKAKLNEMFKSIIYLTLLGIISVGLVILPGTINPNYLEYDDVLDQKEEIYDEEGNRIKTNITLRRIIRFANTIKELTIDKLSSGSGEIRTSQEKVALSIWKDYPVLGLGFGSIATYILFTNVLVNFGILGELVFIAAIISAVVVIYKNRYKDIFFAKGVCYSILAICICFASCISDLTYLFFYIILVLGIKYFTLKELPPEKKEKLVIGIDARGLDANKTGITTYIEETVKQIVKLDNTDTKYILYSCRDINIDIEENDRFILKKCKAKKGTLWVYFKIQKLLYEDGVDVFWGTQHLLPMRNHYSKNIKYVLTIHDLAIHKLKTVGQFKNTIIQRLFVKTSCKAADTIMADSEATKKDIEEILGIDERKIKVVYLGTNFTSTYNVPKDNEKEILKKFNVEDRNYLFFVSTIEPRKNIVTLIKAFEELREKETENKIKLILAGGLGWKYQDVIDTIDNSKYKEDINLAGYISKEEKECLLYNAKCFVYPSLYEGFGLPVLEAMSKDSVVVTSNISSLPEVGGDAAFYLNDVHDHIELATIIKKALNLTNEERTKIIEKGHKQVEKFTWKKCASEIIDILKGENNI